MMRAPTLHTMREEQPLNEAAGARVRGGAEAPASQRERRCGRGCQGGRARVNWKTVRKVKLFGIMSGLFTCHGETKLAHPLLHFTRPSHTSSHGRVSGT
jgi:hypothetical protein